MQQGLAHKTGTVLLWLRHCAQVVGWQSFRRKMTVEVLITATQLTQVTAANQALARNTHHIVPIISQLEQPPGSSLPSAGAASG
jgi:hypothetical protein